MSHPRHDQDAVVPCEERNTPDEAVGQPGLEGRVVPARLGPGGQQPQEAEEVALCTTVESLPHQQYGEEHGHGPENGVGLEPGCKRAEQGMNLRDLGR